LNISFDNKVNHSRLTPPASIASSPSKVTINLLRHCSDFLDDKALNESLNKSTPLRLTLIL